MHLQIEVNKIFHLVEENTVDLKEKAFLVEERLQGVEKSFKAESKVIGLVGTSESIK